MIMTEKAIATVQPGLYFLPRKRNARVRRLCFAISTTSRRRSRKRVRAGLSQRADEAKQVQSLKRTPLAERDVVRLGLPSKGRMAEDTMQLLTDCQLTVYKPNPRQYVAKIPQMPGVEAWFQRASDVVKKLRYGDVDLGIVGYDMFCELAEGDPDLILIHEALDFGKCHLSLGVPLTGTFADVKTLDDLREMDRWSETQPLHVVTGYLNIARRFFAEHKFEHVVLLSGDGALEAAPAMGSGDIILDLVSTGVTLRENNLREIEGGKVLESQGVLVGNRQSLLNRRGLLRIVRELLDRLDAHLKAEQYYSVISNMRGSTPEAIAAKLQSIDGLAGLQGPTISPVFSSVDTDVAVYAACICVKKQNLYQAVKDLRKLGGSGVLVQPMTYIFDEESSRWKQLLRNLNVVDESMTSGGLSE